MVLELEVLSFRMATLLLGGRANSRVSQSDATLSSKTSALSAAAWNTSRCIDVQLNLGVLFRSRVAFKVLNGNSLLESFAAAFPRVLQKS